MPQIDEAKSLGEKVADRETELGFTRYRPCPHPERHQTTTYIPCQDCDVRANPALNTEAKHEPSEREVALVNALEILRSTLRPVLRDHEVRGNVDRTEGYVLVALNQIDAALAGAQETK